MAQEKKQEAKMILEREYIVPLRHGWLKVPRYQRAKKAVKTLKEFLAQHMKVYDRDLRKIKVDIYLNNELRFRGMKKPPAKIKVKAKKFDDGIVRVELAVIPPAVSYKKLKDEKRRKRPEKKIETKKENKEVHKEANKTEEAETKEKETAAKEEAMKLAKEKHKETKHLSPIKEPQIRRQVLKK